VVRWTLQRSNDWCYQCKIPLLAAVKIQWKFENEGGWSACTVIISLRKNIGYPVTGSKCNNFLGMSVLSKSRVRGIKLRCILLRLCAIKITFNVTLKNIFRLSWALRFFLSTWSLWGRRTVWMPQGKESLHYQVRIFGLISVTAAGHPFVKQWKHDRKAA